MLVSTKHKICVTPKAKHKACQWNIGCFGSPMQNFCVGHVHFMLFVFIWLPDANPVCSGIWALGILPLSLSQVFTGGTFLFGLQQEELEILSRMMKLLSLVIDIFNNF